MTQHDLAVLHDILAGVRNRLSVWVREKRLSCVHLACDTERVAHDVAAIDQALGIVGRSIEG